MYQYNKYSFGYLRPFEVKPVLAELFTSRAAPGGAKPVSGFALSLIVHDRTFV